jgi:flagellum-specific ATP synthase
VNQQLLKTSGELQPNVHRQRWHDHIRDCKEILRIVEPLEIAGRIVKLTGLVMEAVGIKLPIGSACFVPLSEGHRVEAEVVGFDGERMLLMPQSSVDGVVPGAKVFALEVAESLPKPHHGQPPRRRVTDRARHLPVGNELLGRVLDGAGNPLDSLGPIRATQSAALTSRPMNPLMRAPIED